MGAVAHHVAAVLDLLANQRTALETRIQVLHERIGQLAEELAQAQAEATSLDITRDTLTGLANQAREQAPAQTPEAGPAYQAILGALHTGGPLRARQLCQLLDLGTSAVDVKRVHARLKRLVARQVLTEPEQGLFALATRTPD